MRWKWSNHPRREHTRLNGSHRRCKSSGKSIQGRVHYGKSNSQGISLLRDVPMAIVTTFGGERLHPI